MRGLGILVRNSCHYPGSRQVRALFDVRACCCRARRANLPSRVSRLMVAPSLLLRWRSCSFIEDILEDALSPYTTGKEERECMMRMRDGDCHSIIHCAQNDEKDLPLVRLSCFSLTNHASCDDGAPRCQSQAATLVLLVAVRM
jgi:hypothetical protein